MILRTPLSAMMSVQTLCKTMKEKRLHTHHGAQRRSDDHRTWSPRRCCRRSKGTSNRLSPGRHTHSHDGAFCSWLLHQPLHNLENSISAEPALGSVEATPAYSSSAC